MKKLIFVLMAASLVACRTSEHLTFKKGDTVQVGSLFKSNTFEISKVVQPGVYQAWDLRTHRHVDRLAGVNLKRYRVKSK